MIVLTEQPGCAFKILKLKDRLNEFHRFIKALDRIGYKLGMFIARQYLSL